MKCYRVLSRKGGRTKVKLVDESVVLRAGFTNDDINRACFNGAELVGKDARSYLVFPVVPGQAALDYERKPRARRWWFLPPGLYIKIDRCRRMLVDPKREEPYRDHDGKLGSRMFTRWTRKRIDWCVRVYRKGDPVQLSVCYASSLNRAVKQTEAMGWKEATE